MGHRPPGCRQATAKGAFATAAVELLSVLAITKGKALSNGDDRNATLAVSGIAFGFGGLMGAIVSRERWRTLHVPLSVAPPRDTTAR